MIVMITAMPGPLETAPGDVPPSVIPSRVDLVVLGAGPAGLFAAIEARRTAPDSLVIVCERRPFAGGQVPVSGGGRCNVTNAGSIESLMAGFGRDGRWLEPALRHFDNVQIIRWFEARGVAMKQEEDGKIFPASDQGADVQNAMIHDAERMGVSIYLKTRVENVHIENGRIVAVTANGSRVECRALVVASGGTGPRPTPTHGVTLAAAMGHGTVPPAPALAPIKLKNRDCEALSGVSLQVTVRAGATGFAAKKPKIMKTGILLFTHFGLSGPVILDLSHPIARLAARGDAELSIDVLPGESDARAALDALLVRSGGKAIKNASMAGIPHRVWEHLLKIVKIDPDVRCAEVRAEEREALCRILKDWRFSQFEVTWAGAMVTGGGIALNEVDPKSMRSRRVAGLYFAGETLDLQGECGGFNLQASFSTGALAGRSAAEYLLSTSR